MAPEGYLETLDGPDGPRSDATRRSWPRVGLRFPLRTPRMQISNPRLTAVGGTGRRLGSQSQGSHAGSLAGTGISASRRLSLARRSPPPPPGPSCSLTRSSTRPQHAARPGTADRGANFKGS